MKITVARLIRNKIESWKVKEVPIFQGGAIMNVLSEIAQSKKISHYCPYHEQALAMGVDAYSRLNGFGVGLVTSGPGATNLITGIGCSYYDSIPNIYFTGQVGQFHLVGNRNVRQRGFQESDVVSLMKPITKFSYQIKNPNEVDYILDKAYHIAKSGRPGPVVIDIPFNIQKVLIDEKKLKKFKINKEVIKKENEIKKIFKDLKKSKKPLIIAGGGVRISNQVKFFLNFVKKNKLPFATTWPSQDITSSDNNLYFGSVGKHAHLSASILASKADLIITLGVRFSPKIVCNKFAEKAKLIAIDIDSSELNEGLISPDVKLKCPISYFLKESKKFKVHVHKDWIQKCEEIKLNNFRNFTELKKFKSKYLNPYFFTERLSKFVKNNAILLTDAGANLTFFMQAFRSKKNQRILSAWGNSPMGYSVAAGIGAKIAKKKIQVISLIGDGSFLINLQELQFIKFNNINLKIVVYDNKVFGNTKIGCEDYKIKSIGNDAKGGYYSPELKKISKTFDIKYFYLKNDRNIDMSIKKFLNQKGSAILHLNISKDHHLLEHKINS